MHTMGDPGDNSIIWMIHMIPKLLFVMFALIIISFFAYFLFFNEIKIENMEKHVFFNRLIYSTNALAYYDEDLGRTYLGMIDLEKFTTENIEATINYPENRYFAANLTLAGKESVYYHRELYDNLKPLAYARIRGSGGADLIIKELKVSYIENDKLKSGLLKIEIIRARS